MLYKHNSLAYFLVKVNFNKAIKSKHERSWWIISHALISVCLLPLPTTPFDCKWNKKSSGEREIIFHRFHHTIHDPVPKLNKKLLTKCPWLNSSVKLQYIERGTKLDSALPKSSISKRAEESDPILFQRCKVFCSSTKLNVVGFAARGLC